MLSCDARFSFDLDPAIAGAPLEVSFTDDPGHVYIGLDVTGPGSPSAEFLEVGGAGPYTWRFRVTGLVAGILDISFTIDEGEVLATCQHRVVVGEIPDGGPAPDADSACVANCNGVPCGGDDGCGTACSGGWRDDHGAVSDCRAGGDCGCGVEPNDNMQCTGSGMCRIRCSCDCLPPQDRTATAVAGLDHAESCRLVFRESGDPTVWDVETDSPLCPLDHDPSGAARCTECPPCHRDHPPSCDWDQWCVCRDARWIDGYRADCCAAGDAYCF